MTRKFANWANVPTYQGKLIILYTNQPEQPQARSAYHCKTHKAQGTFRMAPTKPTGTFVGAIHIFPGEFLLRSAKALISGKKIMPLVKNLRCD